MAILHKIPHSKKFLGEKIFAKVLKLNFRSNLFANGSAFAKFAKISAIRYVFIITSHRLLGKVALTPAARKLCTL